MQFISKKAVASGLLALILSACGTGQTTPRRHIYVTGTQALDDVDTAWDIAARLAGVDAAAYADRTSVTVNVQEDAITMSDTSTRYHGLSTSEAGMTVCRVQLVGASLLDAETPGVHELLHSILFLRDGNQDPNHRAAGWKESDRDYTKEGE